MPEPLDEKAEQLLENVKNRLLILDGSIVEAERRASRSLECSRGELLSMSMIKLDADHYMERLEVIHSDPARKGSMVYESGHRGKVHARDPVEVSHGSSGESAGRWS